MSEVIRPEEKSMRKAKPRIRSFRKYQMLLLIANGVCTSSEISGMLKIPLKTATSRLCTYRNSGFICVGEKEYSGMKGRPVFHYDLTRRGKERLAFFDSSW